MKSVPKCPTRKPQSVLENISRFLKNIKPYVWTLESSFSMLLYISRKMYWLVYLFNLLNLKGGLSPQKNNEE
jgi:hypothetical protein